MEEQNNKPKLVIDLRQLVNGIDNNISENTDIQNEIWQGVLKLVITLSSSMLVLSIAFVDEVFVKSRERFGLKRKNGARKLKGAAGAVASEIWSARDLQKID